MAFSPCSTYWMQYNTNPVEMKTYSTSTLIVSHSAAPSFSDRLAFFLAIFCHQTHPTRGYTG